MTETTEGIAFLTTRAMLGNGVDVWLLPEGNVQLGLVCSVGLLGGAGAGVDGAGVGAQGKDREQPVELKTRLMNTRAVRIYLIFFGILVCC